jgi:hypothetical protein
MPEAKKVAAVVTVYRKWSHADLIVGKILEGFNFDNGERPNLKLVSLYVDQVGPHDMSRRLARQYGFRLYNSIAGALTLGGKELAVDGVISVGEHGDYPTNARGQILYPRRRFFAEICQVFEKCKRSVPVFNDKHLAATWEDARWMYDRARELYVPFLAGSSIPLTWRRPDLRLARNSPLTSAVQICYGPFEGYGFHGLEGMQCMAERRVGGETGVVAVQCLQEADIWKSLDQGRWSKEVLEAGLKLVTAHAKGDVRSLVGKEGAVYLIEYRDGFQAAVVLLNGWIYEGEGGNFIWAGKLKGQDRPVATMFYMQQPDPFGHFNYLVKAIESMVQTGHAPYPVERTLLTTGVLDALMRSKSEKDRRVETPHLAIKYQPTDWPYASGPVPREIKRPFPEEKG